MGNNGTAKVVRIRMVQTALREQISLGFLLARADFDDESGCLLWRGALPDAKGPCSCMRDALGRSFKFNVRAEVLALAREVRAQRGRHVVCKFGDKRCVHPDHLVSIRPGVQLRGRRLSADQYAKQIIGRRKQGKLGLEVARAIRASCESTAALCLRFGISKTTVHRIRNHVIYREHGGMLGFLMKAQAL